jgi:hypothetical protein
VRRRDVGVVVLALSVAYSAVDLLGWLHPVLLRMGVHEGPRRTFSLLLGSLTFKTILLASGILLAFWPERPGRRSRP